MLQPPWMPHAWADLGTAESAGSRHNARILDYFRRVGHADIRDDETPWCAAFVGACLERAGIASSRSLAARSYLGWGVATDAPTLGTIVVLSRGADPSLGHVGFLVGETATHVLLLGGNQSNAVTVTAYDRTRVLARRLPAPIDARVTVPTGTTSEIAPTDADPTRGPDFSAALAMVLAFEGGWSDDPFDPGGPTNKGITLATYAREKGLEVTADNRFRLTSELRDIPDALVELIYEHRYWQPACCPDLPPALALFHFDVAVNMGVGTAARLLQETLEVAIDGEIGPITLAAAQARPLDVTLETYAALRRRRYRARSTFWRFGRGWLRRTDEALARALALAEPTPLADASRPNRRPSTTTPKKGNSRMSDFPVFPAPSTQQPASQPIDLPGKWWGGSLTIWGALLTALTTVAPTVFAAFGFNISAALLQQLSGEIVTAAQAIGGLVGTILTIVGRLRATTRIERRALTLRV